MYLLERINKTTLAKAVLDCIQCKLLPLENRDHFVLKIPFLRLKGSKGIFRFKCLLYNFGDYWDNHGMQTIILDYFFQLLRWKWEYFISGPFNIFYQFLWDLWKRTGDYWYKHVVWNDWNIKNHFWALCEKIPAPGTEFPRIFCAGISLLQLSVLLI